TISWSGAKRSAVRNFAKVRFFKFGARSRRNFLWQHEFRARIQTRCTHFELIGALLAGSTPEKRCRKPMISPVARGARQCTAANLHGRESWACNPAPAPRAGCRHTSGGHPLVGPADAR